MSEHSDNGGWSADADSVVPEFPAVPGYEILAELGRGGMGVVYKARRSQTGELVALKLIRDGALAGSVERARFRCVCPRGCFGPASTRPATACSAA